MKAARWGDHDHYLGPFTVSWSDHYRTFAVCLRSSDDEDRAATFRVSVGRFSFLSVVPAWFVRPERKKVYPRWDAATVQRLGRDWYWDITPREYSVGITDGHMSVYYGRVTNDSSTEQYWGYFLPWTQWRHVRHSLYGFDGSHFWTESRGAGWEAFRNAKDACPRVAFDFEDHDGERLIATTMIEEREWHFGDGWFKWLSWFRPHKIRRNLDIEFSGETGPEKGSWKGGATGTGIEMLPGELHDAAFQRYCGEDHRSKHRPYKVKFLGRAASSPLA